MKKFYIKGTDTLVRNSQKNYTHAVCYRREDSSLVVYSCHTSRQLAEKKILSLYSDYIRHSSDFNIDYDPGKFAIFELEAK